MPTNSTTNRLSLVLTQDKLTKINDLLTQLGNELDFTIGLTTEERKSLPKMNDGSEPFVSDAITGAQQNSELFPGYLKLDEMVRDYTLYSQLNPLGMRLQRLGEQLSDTQMLAGSEAYVTGLSIYRLSEAAAKAGLPGADTLYQKLRLRFVAQSQPATEKA